MTDPEDNTSTYLYDGNNNLRRQTNALGHATEFEYDARDRVIERRYADTHSESFAYDPAGNRRLHIDALGQSRVFHHDTLNRLSVAEYPAAVGDEPHRVEYRYLPEGQLHEVREIWDGGEGLSRYEYDLFDRLEIETDRFGQRLQHVYDLKGNRRQRIDSHNGTVHGTTHYDIDALDRIRAVTAPGRGAVEIHYTQQGQGRRIARIEHPDGTGSEQRFNSSGRLESILHERAGQREAYYAYTYDGNGNRLTQTEDLGQGERLTEYVYDSADRLIETTRAGRRTVYVLNEVANRIEERRYHDGNLSEHRQLHYNHRDQLTEITDGEGQLLVENHYDPRGNRIATIDGGTHTVYRFGARDRLLGIHLQGAPPETGPRYRYDDAGFRIEELRPEQGLRFRYDGSQLAFETNVVGNLLTRYQHGPDRVLAETRNSQTLTWLTDALKTPVKRLSDDGSCYSTSHYDEYGKLESETSPDTPRFGFTGYQRSEGTELYYAEQRWYDASSGRFISEDPLWGDAQTPLSLHRYLYAYANPTVWVDPDGRIAILNEDARELLATGRESSLEFARTTAAAMQDAPWYSRPGLAMGWAAGGAGYLASGFGEFVTMGANVAANAMVTAADAGARAAGLQDSVFSPLAQEARQETQNVVEAVAPLIGAFAADPRGSARATAGALGQAVSSEAGALASGDSRAVFDLAGNFVNPQRMAGGVYSSVRNAVSPTSACRAPTYRRTQSQIIRHTICG